VNTAALNRAIRAAFRRWLLAAYAEVPELRSEEVLVAAASALAKNDLKIVRRALDFHIELGQAMDIPALSAFFLCAGRRCMFKTITKVVESYAQGPNAVRMRVALWDTVVNTCLSKNPWTGNDAVRLLDFYLRHLGLPLAEDYVALARKLLYAGQHVALTKLMRFPMPKAARREVLRVALETASYGSVTPRFLRTALFSGIFKATKCYEFKPGRGKVSLLTRAVWMGEPRLVALVLAFDTKKRYTKVSHSLHRGREALEWSRYFRERWQAREEAEITAMLSAHGIKTSAWSLDHLNYYYTGAACGSHRAW
jgi:hypothetical protein